MIAHHLPKIKNTLRQSAAPSRTWLPLLILQCPVEAREVALKHKKQTCVFVEAASTVIADESQAFLSIYWQNVLFIQPGVLGGGRPRAGNSL